MLDWQSDAILQAFPTPHFVVQEPPQSTSVSVPFFARSLHAAAWQTLVLQTPLAQSEPVEQALPFAQVLVGAQPPPQSVSVSVPFLVLSPQVAAWQIPPVQT